MMALSDFGGFNDGVMFIPKILMGFYSSKMFLQNLFDQLPTKKKSKQTQFNHRNQMRERCNQDQF